MILEGRISSELQPGMDLGLGIPMTEEQSPEETILDCKMIQRVILKVEPDADTTKIRWRVYDPA